jgi:hypothetical protein
MEIFAENIRAIQAIYGAATLEEMRAFAATAGRVDFAPPRSSSQ